MTAKGRKLAALLLVLVLLAACPANAPASRLTRTTCLPADQLPSAEVRLPGPVRLSAEEQAAILAAGSLSPDPVLEQVLSLLEEGSPFLVRYNLLTGSSVSARMPFGVPYLFGGQTASHVFAKEPDYVVQQAGSNSPAYYRKGTWYLYGFDCVGLAKWLWKQNREEIWPTVDVLLQSRGRQLWNSAGKAMPAWEELPGVLSPGDMLIYRHPGTHVVFYIGTLRQYGYTAEEIPELAPWLDWPLVIHCGTNAGVARRFAWLIDNGLSKYRIAADTDGGVAVSLLGVDPALAPYHIHQQNQDTWYFTLPDGTWLTVVPWKNVTAYAWFPLTEASPAPLAAPVPTRREEVFTLTLRETEELAVASRLGDVRECSLTGTGEGAGFRGDLLPGGRLTRLGEAAELRCVLQGTGSVGEACLVWLAWDGETVRLRTDSGALAWLETEALTAALEEAGEQTLVHVFRQVPVHP